MSSSSAAALTEWLEMGPLHGVDLYAHVMAEFDPQRTWRQQPHVRQFEILFPGCRPRMLMTVRRCGR